MSAATPKNQSKGQLAYEQERAKKAGKSLEEWRRAKVKAKQDTEKKAAPKPAKKPGVLGRLLERAHKPI